MRRAARWLAVQAGTCVMIGFGCMFATFATLAQLAQGQA